MNRSMQSTRRTFVKATSVGVGVGGLGLGGVAGSAAAVDNSTPRLATEGKWIVTEDGQWVKLRGVGTASLEFLDGGTGPLNDGFPYIDGNPYDEVADDWSPMDHMDVLERATDGEQWQPNAVRLPITEEVYHTGSPAYLIDDLLRPAVDLLAERGVYAILDLHLVRPYVDATEQALEMIDDGRVDDVADLGFDPYTETDELVREIWQEIAPAFADDDNVLFELFSDPTLPTARSEYGQYGSAVETHEDEWRLWRSVAQPWVDMIREHAPETPIIIGSPDRTSRTAYAAEYPFEGENLIYASHIYPGDGLPHETAERPDGEGGIEELEPFDPEYGTPAEEVPIVCTEFGWDPERPRGTRTYGTTSEWGQPVREWLESYENVGWVAWCFDDIWMPSFFDSPDEYPGESWELHDDPERMGWFVREWLEETSNDLFVDDGNEDTYVSIGDYRPRDTTDDGLYNDFDGDGETTHDDVTAFFENIEDDDIHDNPDAFDFDENGLIGFGDVIGLLRRI